MVQCEKITFIFTITHDIETSDQDFLWNFLENLHNIEPKINTIYWFISNDALYSLESFISRIINYGLLISHKFFCNLDHFQAFFSQNNNYRYFERNFKSLEFHSTNKINELFINLIRNDNSRVVKL